MRIAEGAGLKYYCMKYLITIKNEEVNQNKKMTKLVVAYINFLWEIPSKLAIHYNIKNGVCFGWYILYTTPSSLIMSIKNGVG